MDMELKFSFSFKPELVEDDCSKPFDDARVYELYGREIERTVERVMRFICDYVDVENFSKVLALSGGFQGRPNGVNIVESTELENALVGWFTIIFFSCALTYSRSIAAGKDLYKAVGYVSVRADQYGGVHLQISQLEESGKDPVECQSLDILNVSPCSDADLGASLREKFAGKVKRASVVASAL